MWAVGLGRSRPAFPRHFAQALHFARSPGRGLLAKCHPCPDVRNQVPGPSDNRPVSCRAAKRCLTPFQGDEICLVPINPALPWTTFQLTHVRGTDPDSSMSLSQSLTFSKRHWKCCVLHIDVIPSTISENASPCAVLSLISSRRSARLLMPSASSARYEEACLRSGVGVTQTKVERPRI